MPSEQIHKFRSASQSKCNRNTLRRLKALVQLSKDQHHLAGWPNQHQSKVINLKSIRRKKKNGMIIEKLLKHFMHLA
uniref:Uncharacterized protein n=1 Tax=Rhizophora mucronata TaxID=61149 RepID=A0A2P2Q5Z5_RHIMU